MLNLDEVNVAHKIESQFDVALKVSISSEAVAIDQLTSKERERFGELGSARMLPWLKGRSALKRLLDSLGEDEETAHINFPSSRFSLTHSGEFAVAIGTDSAKLLGIGVDFEVRRRLPAETARFFLTESERTWLMTPEQTREPTCLLRLWTIKEALFKSDPRNLERWLSDYVVQTPDEPRGRAFVRGEEGLEFSYSSFELEEGFLSVAVLPRRQDDA
jgi:phosphopantetheinyl transferase (holo-ACP synthase)